MQIRKAYYKCLPIFRYGKLTALKVEKGRNCPACMPTVGHIPKPTPKPWIENNVMQCYFYTRQRGRPNWRNLRLLSAIQYSRQKLDPGDTIQLCLTLVETKSSVPGHEEQ
jgi:hypothetical protein